MSARYKVMCGCERFISAKIIHSSLLSWCNIYLNNLKDLSQIAQNRRYGEIANHIFDAYKNSVIPYGNHIYATAYDMDMATMFAYQPSHNELTQWKYVLSFCSNFPRIDLPVQELDMTHSNTSPEIRFHISHLIAHCTVHGRRLMDENKFCRLCLIFLDSVPPAKLYTRKDLVIMKKYIADFHTSFYIPEIKKLAFHFPHV